MGNLSFCPFALKNPELIIYHLDHWIFLAYISLLVVKHHWWRILIFTFFDPQAKYYHFIVFTSENFPLDLKGSSKLLLLHEWCDFRSCASLSLLVLETHHIVDIARERQQLISQIMITVTKKWPLQKLSKIYPISESRKVDHCISASTLASNL